MNGQPGNAADRQGRQLIATLCSKEEGHERLFETAQSVFFDWCDYRRVGGRSNALAKNWDSALRGRICTTWGRISICNGNRGIANGRLDGSVVVGSSQTRREKRPPYHNYLPSCDGNSRFNNIRNITACHRNESNNTASRTSRICERSVSLFICQIKDQRQQNA